MTVTWGRAGRPGCPLPRRGHRTTRALCGFCPVQPQGCGWSWDEDPWERGGRGRCAGPCEGVGAPPEARWLLSSRECAPAQCLRLLSFSALFSLCPPRQLPRCYRRVDFERKALGAPVRTDTMHRPGFLSQQKLKIIQREIPGPFCGGRRTRQRVPPLSTAGQADNATWEPHGRGRSQRRLPGTR